METLPPLSLLVLLPLAGSLVCALTRAPLQRAVAVTVAALILLLSLLYLLQFDKDASGFQFLERHVWIDGLGLDFLFGVDGLSILFLPVTALLFLVVMLLTPASLLAGGTSWFSLLLLLQAASTGIFLALDTMLFFLFWELTLPPLFFLVSQYGIGPERRIAAMKYTLYMLFGGAPLLFAFILLALNHAEAVQITAPEGLSFSLPELLQTPVPPELQTLLFVLFLLGFGVKAPLVPLHTWLPKVALEGPLQITAILLGMKLGIYGFLRFLLPLAPEALVDYQRVLALLGTATLGYAAMLALRQNNLRLLLAWAGISHVGAIVLGLASLTQQGIQGGILMLLNFSLVAAPLMLLAAALHARMGSTDLSQLQGLAVRMPKLATLFVLYLLASLGAPLTLGFPAELLLLQGNFRVHPGLGITALCGAVVVAAAMLNWLRRGMWGSWKAGLDASSVHDLTMLETLVAGLVLVLVLVFGLFPHWLLDYTSTWSAGLVPVLNQ